MGERQKKPMKVVRTSDRASIAREMNPPPLPPQPSWAVLTAAQQNYHDQQYDDYDQHQPELAGPSRASQQALDAPEKEPLFLPSSQLSQQPAAVDSGLGIEHMTAEELEMMLEGDAEEVVFSQDRIKKESAEEDELEYVGEDWRSQDRMEFMIGEGGDGTRGESLELVDDMEMAPTQNDGGMKVREIRSIVCALRSLTSFRCSDRFSRTDGAEGCIGGSSVVLIMICTDTIDQGRYVV